MDRVQLEQIIQGIKANKLLLISGSRLAGKEQLVAEATTQMKVEPLTINLANKKERKVLEEEPVDELCKSFNGFKMVVIYEAQYYNKLTELIQLTLNDTIHARIILVCSFLPNLDTILLEVLKNQGLHLKVYPPSFYELAKANGLPNENTALEERLIFGSYQAVLDKLDNAQEILNHLLDTVLLTDLSVKNRINNEKGLLQLLRILSFKVGEAISFNELATHCKLDNETVERYVYLLEKAHILLVLSTFESGKRYELRKSHMVFFIDNGIRNALIQNFNSFDLRIDQDALWLNWLIAERIKWNNIQGLKSQFYFWKSHTKQQIEFIEQNDEQLKAYKASWRFPRKIKFPKLFQQYYPQASTHPLTPTTFWGFLSKK